MSCEKYCLSGLTFARDVFTRRCLTRILLRPCNWHCCNACNSCSRHELPTGRHTWSAMRWCAIHRAPDLQMFTPTFCISWLTQSGAVVQEAGCADCAALLVHCPNGQSQPAQSYLVGDESSACSQRGTCSMGTAVCSCYTGYQGLACEFCAPGFTAHAGTCLLEILAKGSCWARPDCAKQFEAPSGAKKSNTLQVSVIAVTAGVLSLLTVVVLVTVFFFRRRRRQQARMLSTLSAIHSLSVTPSVPASPAEAGPSQPPAVAVYR